MPNLKWLEYYSGQTTEELLSLDGEYRIDSLVVAFEQALDQKAARDGQGALSREERLVLAIEALEREVNNGGYGQFFINSSREFVPAIVDALLQIGCPKAAEITRNAVDALQLSNISIEDLELVMTRSNHQRDEQLRRCDDRYFQSAEDIAGHLFAFIRANHDAIKLRPENARSVG